MFVGNFGRLSLRGRSLKYSIRTPWRRGAVEDVNEKDERILLVLRAGGESLAQLCVPVRKAEVDLLGEVGERPEIVQLKI